MAEVTFSGGCRAVAVRIDEARELAVELAAGDSVAVETALEIRQAARDAQSDDAIYLGSAQRETVREALERLRSRSPLPDDLEDLWYELRPTELL